MRPPAGGGKLKHAPPMQANNLLLVAQAVPPANYIFLHLFSERVAVEPKRAVMALVRYH